VTLVLEGHESVVYDARFSPDGRHLVSSSWDGSAILWDAGDGTRLLTQRAHEAPVFGALFEGNDRVWSLGLDGALRCWPVDPLAFVRRLPERGFLPAERQRYGIEDGCDPGEGIEEGR
jgi:WD40 repeat protein